MREEHLFRAKAPGMVAGFVASQDGIVFFTAPVLKRRILGMKLDEAIARLETEGWTVKSLGRRVVPR